MTTTQTIHTLATIALDLRNHKITMAEAYPQLHKLPKAQLEHIQQETAIRAANENTNPNDKPAG